MLTLEQEWESVVKRFNRLAALVVRKREGEDCGGDHEYVNYLTEIRWGVKTKYFKCLVCEAESKEKIDVHIA